MKTKTKALVICLCAVLLVATTVFATMAYLTSSATVKNTFTVGNVSITLDEAPVDQYGSTVSGDRVTSNTYKLIPGHKYTKDPTVHVASGSEKCWLFVKLENGLAGAELTESGAKTISSQMSANWTLIDSTNNIYAYKAQVSGGQNIVVFSEFTVGKTANVASYASSDITVTAYAIQADGFASAQAAWTAAGITG